MNTTHWDRTYTLVERASQDATDADALIDRVGVLLADAVEADAHVFLRLDPLTALWLGATGRGYDPASCGHFASKVFLHSEVADYAASARAPQAVVRVSRDALPAEDAYSRYYFEDLGFEEDLHASFTAGGQIFGHLTLARQQGSYTAAAVRLVERSVPVVASALRRLLARETLESVPGEGVGLMLVDAEGRVSAANGLGGEILERARVTDPQFTRTALSAVVELARRDLARAVPSQLPRVVYLEPGTQRRYRLVAERMQMAPGASPVALVVAEPIRALDSVELLRTAGLTEREAEVALILLRGFKSAEGAAALGMSEHTFLSHLKAVYRKVGVGSRGELAAFMLSGA